ncbi:unnamed protein product [Ilex paraguariensis]|uniref:Polygalacturonase n=1 Tax=Ilex paraguariensis TaxID=185542 RepID=A0ABC8T623_9AQUA
MEKNKHMVLHFCTLTRDAALVLGDQRTEQKKTPRTCIGNVASLTLLLSMVSAMYIPSESIAGQSIFNVLNYEAAFAKTWESTCNADTESVTMVIPQGKTFLVHLITWAGPCKPKNVNILLSGTILGPESPDAWKGKNPGWLLIFQGVKGLNISGSGTIEGRGKGWWDISCALHPQLEAPKALWSPSLLASFLASLHLSRCKIANQFSHLKQGCIKLAPMVLSFINCTKVYMNNISFVNSPQTHVGVSGCYGVNFKFLSINSPASSPNTDGIHISRSRRVSIDSTNIGSGDDCISIGDQTSNIYITDVSCGPGHGVSIGSLGRSGNEVQVENITMTRVHFYNTTNRARIKTWQKTGVHVSDVRYSGTFGTSKTKLAINLNCSDAVPCTKILFDTIQLASSTPGYKVNSSCNNAYGHAKGIKAKHIIPAKSLLIPLFPYASRIHFKMYSKPSRGQ